MPYFVVRIEHPEAGRTRFTVEPSDIAPEASMALFDSTPAVICGVEADHPGGACSAAWDKGKHLLESAHGKPVYTADDFLRALDSLRPAGLLPAPEPGVGISEAVAESVRSLLGVTYLRHDLEGGPWECPDPEGPDPEMDGKPRSPTGKCVYVPYQDPCRDHCLFCGLPEERK